MIGKADALLLWAESHTRPIRGKQGVLTVSPSISDPLPLGGESEKAEIALLQLAVRGTNVHQAEFAGCAISCCNSRQIEGTQKDLNNNKIRRNKLYILRLILQYSKNTAITHPIFCTIYVKIKFYFVTPGVSNSICA